MIFKTLFFWKFSKFKNFLWVCWFLGKNLSNFLPPPVENSTNRIAIIWVAYRLIINLWFWFEGKFTSLFPSISDTSKLVKGLLEKSWIYLDLKKTMNCRNTLNTLNFMSLFCTQKVDVLRLHILFILINFLVTDPILYRTLILHILCR